jgi:beta-glucosidase
VSPVIDQVAVLTDAAPAHAGERRFPGDFRWGVATAAYQIEGSTTEDGRGRSIWDTFARTPGKVHLGHTGDVACDHYRRYRHDVALMRELNVGTYRFSVAWPRIVPDGTGPANSRGLDFYDRLVDTLMETGINPMVTLYHWDLPQALEDHGGWTNRRTAYHFADYARVVHARLGDRVRTWTTLNEPWCSAFLGYASGEHAPGRTDPVAAFAALHHLLLGHGLAAEAMRSAGAREVSITLNLTPVSARDPDDPHDLDAVGIIDGLQNRIFLDPLLRGAYPEDLQPILERFNALRHQLPGDAAQIAVPLDLLGVNYYAPGLVAARVGSPASPIYPGSEGVTFPDQGRPVTAMGWPIGADGLVELLTRLARDYPGTPLIITENGAAFEDQLVDGQVHDTERVDYLRAHLDAALTAIEAGVDLRGYLAWSLLDNYEWAHGYSKRFGLVHVDYATQRRTPKRSALFYRDVIARRSLPTGG